MTDRPLVDTGVKIQDGLRVAWTAQQFWNAARPPGQNAGCLQPDNDSENRLIAHCTGVLCHNLLQSGLDILVNQVHNADMQTYFGNAQISPMNPIDSLGVGPDMQRISRLFKIMESHLKGYQTFTERTS